MAPRKLSKIQVDDERLNRWQDHVIGVLNPVLSDAAPDNQPGKIALQPNWIAAGAIDLRKRRNGLVTLSAVIQPAAGATTPFGVLSAGWGTVDSATFAVLPAIIYATGVPAAAGFDVQGQNAGAFNFTTGVIYIVSGSWQATAGD